MDFEHILRQVRRPSRYAGGEVNAVIKDPAKVSCRVALAYPDLYELGMSYLGLQVLYHAVNRENDLWAERVFAPDVDFAAALEASGQELFSIESRTPLSRFDLLGFTLQHELTYPDVLAMLKMGGIPLRSDQRGPRDPIVIAGGPGASNPEPLAPALDAVFLGDAEEGIVEMARLVGRARRERQSRQEILDRLVLIPGVYVPSRYECRFDDRGLLLHIAPKEGAPARVRRRLIPELAPVVCPETPVVSAREAIHDRLAIEIQRGCTRGCRFCQAGMINRPVRQRTAGRVLDAVDQGLRVTGYDQVSLLSLSAGDHPQIIPILEGFFARQAHRRIAASLPSLRAETLTPTMARLVKTVRKSGFTIAPEAGSDRLRRVINKNLTDDEIISAALGAFGAGWQLLKLYFMVGLPTETAEDRHAIVDLVARIRREMRASRLRGRINVGISTFVPKAHTPFQFERMVSAEEALSILDSVRRELAAFPGVKTGWTRAEMSWAEGLLSRGDRRQFGSLCQLVSNGNRLCGWSEHFRHDEFVQAFSGLQTPDPVDGFLRERSTDEVLPWSHLDMGPDTSFLVEERRRALDLEKTPDCTGGECFDCGACREENAIPELAQDSHKQESVVEGPRSEADPAQVHRVRLTLSKEGPAAYLSHLEFMGHVTKALRRASWPLTYSRGFHPKPKLSFGPAGQVGACSRAELVDVFLADWNQADWDTWMQRLRQELPHGIGLIQGARLSPGQPGIMRKAVAIRYRFEMTNGAEPDLVRAGAGKLMSRDTWKVNRVVKGKNKTVEVRPSLRSLEVQQTKQGMEVVCELGLGAGSTARPSEVVREAFGESMARIVREAILFSSDESETPEAACKP